LPGDLPRTIVDVGGIVYSAALDLKPFSVPKHLCPLLTGSDGNCLPRALKRLVFRTEEHHTEVRCRIVIELVRNIDCYTDGIGMGNTAEECRREAAMAATLSDGAALSTSQLSTDQIKAILQGKIIQVKKRS